MNKEKILYRLASIACVLALCCLAYSVIIGKTWAAVAGLSLLVVFAVCDTWSNNIKEEKSPLSYKKRVSALKFVAEKRAGTPEEFIAEHSKELYDCFLKHGYIHEFAVEEGNEANRKWEVTKFGMRRKVEFCS